MSSLFFPRITKIVYKYSLPNLKFQLQYEHMDIAYKLQFPHTYDSPRIAKFCACQIVLLLKELAIKLGKNATRLKFGPHLSS